MGFQVGLGPLIDMIKLHRLGGRKAWIVGCTVMMIVTLLVAATVDYKASFKLLLAMVVLHNVFAATQDVAIDSLAVSTLQPDERGRGNGFMFAGQYLGIALGGGGAVFVTGAFGFEAALAGVAGLLLCNLLFIVFFVRDASANPKTIKQAGALRRLVIAMVSFVKEVYASFWQSASAPRSASPLHSCPSGPWPWPTLP